MPRHRQQRPASYRYQRKEVDNISAKQLVFDAEAVAGMILSTEALVTELTEGHAVGAGAGARGTYD